MYVGVLVFPNRYPDGVFPPTQEDVFAPGRGRGRGRGRGICYQYCYYDPPFKSVLVCFFD